MDDPRLGELLVESDSWEGADVVLLGFPHDEGVRRNGGRVGARHGPATFLERVQRTGALVNAEFDVDLRGLRVVFGGQIGEGMGLEEAHEALRGAVKRAVVAGAVVFVVGGGNDQSAPNGLGLMDALGGIVGVINIDAHFDVRPRKDGKVHSGSPFRLLLEGRGVQHFVEFAAQGAQCSAQHAKFVRDNGGHIEWLSDVRKAGARTSFSRHLDSLGPHAFVSFDLDAVAGCDCPGVSAPSPIGLTAQDALDICLISGRTASVKLFDMSEFNPLIESDRTSRLAAHMFYYFLIGIVQRKT